MIPFLIVALAASLGANAALLIVVIARRATRRPANARPKQRTGNAGRGPARSHMPAHPVPRAPLAADPGRTALVVPVITREITPSPLARRPL